MENVDYESVAESLNEYQSGSGSNYRGEDSYLVREGSRAAFGQSKARHVCEEHGLVMVKTLYKDEFDGVRIWLSPVETEEVEKVVTEERTTIS